MRCLQTCFARERDSWKAPRQAWIKKALRLLSCRAGCFLAILLIGICVLGNQIRDMVLPCYVPWFWARVNRCFGNQPHPWMHPAGQPIPRQPRHSLAVAVVVDNFLSAELREKTIQNKRHYAEHWKYGFLAPSLEEVC